MLKGKYYSTEFRATTFLILSFFTLLWIILGFYSYKIYQDEFQKMALNVFQTNLSSRSYHIKKYLVEKEKDIQLYLNGEIIKEEIRKFIIGQQDKDSEKRLKDYLNNVCDVSNYQSIKIIDEKLKVRFSTDYDDSFDYSLQYITNSDLLDSANIKMYLSSEGKYDFSIKILLPLYDYDKIYGYALTNISNEDLLTRVSSVTMSIDKNAKYVLIKQTMGRFRFFRINKTYEIAEILLDEIVTNKDVILNDNKFFNLKGDSGYVYLYGMQIKGTTLSLLAYDYEDNLLESTKKTRNIIILITIFLIILSNGSAFYITQKLFKKYNKKLIDYKIQQEKLHKHYELSLLEVSDIVMLLDLEGVILQINDYGFNKLKPIDGEINKTDFSSLFPIEKQSYVKEHLAQCILEDKEKIFDSEIRINKEKINVQVKLKKISVENTVYCNCVIHDITEVKNLLKIAEENQRVYQTLLGNLPGIAYRCKNDKNWTMVYLSEGTKELTGYEPEELLYNKTISFDDLICIEYREEIWNSTKEALKKKEHYFYEYEILTKDKKRKIVFDKGTAVYDENGNELFLEGFIIDITSKKQIENELKKSEEQFKKAFENAVTGKSILGLDGKYIKVNKAFCDMLNYTQEELIGVDYRTITDEEDIPESEQKLAKLIEGFVDNYMFNKRYKNKSGETVYVLVSSTLQKDNYGNPQYYITDILNITTEYNTRLELQSSQEKYKQLAESALEGIFIINKEFGLEFINKYAAELIDSKREIEGFLDGSIFNNILNIPNKTILEVFESSRPQMIDTTIVVNGASVFLETKLVPILDENNNAINVLGIARDETKKNEINNKLHETKVMLDTIINSIPQAIFWKDKESNFLGCNKKFAEDGGFLIPDEVINKNDYDFAWRELADKYRRDDKEVMDSGVAKYNILEKIILASGDSRWLITNKMPLYNSTGEIIGIIGVYDDITEKKSTEEELNETLNKLEKSNKELEQFAYVASHDLQEPLRMVASYTQLLEQRYKDKLDDAANEYIFYAVDGAKRMQQLINDLLDYSRILTRGNEFTKVNLSSVIGRVMINLYSKIQESNAIIANGYLPNVLGDEVQIVRVFQNLIDNSIKYSGDKIPGIYISAIESNGWYTVTVKDNGVGISMEYKDKVFELFERLHSSNEFPGTGIGLSICKRIIERHGGRIWLDSNVKEGVSFNFTLKKYED